VGGRGSGSGSGRVSGSRSGGGSGRVSERIVGVCKQRNRDEWTLVDVGCNLHICVCDGGVLQRM
jgi:hypothetical protein